MLKKINKKFLLVIINLLFSYLFYYGYIEFLNGWFNYAGFNIIDGRLDNFLLLFVTFFLAILPLVFYNGFNKISSFICIFIYYLLYVPIIFTYFFNLKGDDFYVIYSQLFFTICIIILFFADKFEFKVKMQLPSDFNFFKFSMIICIVLSLYIAFIYRSNLKFVSFEDVYIHRLGNDQLGDDIFTNYLSIFLQNCFIPICLSYSFFAKKKIYFIVGTFSSLIIYMATAAKSVLFFPILFLVIFYSLRKINIKNAMISIGAGLCVIMVITLMLDFNSFTSIFWMRTIGNGGFLTKYYHDFFLNHPNTYYSHINFVNLITNSYPYDKTLGEVVGIFFWEDADANANFWATDGIAAVGNFGIILSSFILFFIFIIFNSITRNYNKLFLVLVLIPYTFSLLNTSLFSALLSGGALLVLLFLSLKSTNINKFIIN